jgi:hypothetical protein
MCRISEAVKKSSGTWIKGVKGNRSRIRISNTAAYIYQNRYRYYGIKALVTGAGT